MGVLVLNGQRLQFLFYVSMMDPANNFIIVSAINQSEEECHWLILRRIQPLHILLEIFVADSQNSSLLIQSGRVPITIPLDKRVG